MRKIAIHIINFLCFVFWILISGCEHNIDAVEESGEIEIPTGKVQLEIFARVNSYHLPSTRGDEGLVSITPWVLVFKGNDADATFVEAVKAFELVGKRYVLLTAQPIDNKYQLLILANPQPEFYYGDAITGYEFKTAESLAKLSVGVTTLSDACRNLLTEPLASPPPASIPFSGASDTIPMSYLFEVDKIDNTTKIENSDGSSLLLTRVVAKIAIVSKVADFVFDGVVNVANVPRQGRLHNLDNSIMDNTSNLTEYQYDNTYSSLLVTAKAIDGGQSTESTPIYLYESDTQPGTQDEMYLIIKGTYEGQVYYYKLAIVDKNLKPMNIRRNCAYTFTITKVKGRGYDSISDAKASKPSNTALDYMILVDDNDSYEIVANNDYYLGISNSVFIAYTDDDADYEAFKLITDCKRYFPDASTLKDNGPAVDGAFSLLYPGDGKIPVVDGVSTAPRITSVGARVTNWLMWYEDYQKYPGTDIYKNNAYITLKLGNLEKVIHFRQRNAIPAVGKTLKYMPVNDDPVSDEVSYYCLSGYVEDGEDDPKTWIKLRSSTGENLKETDNITVDDGKIYIEVLPNSGSRRTGIVYLATIKDPNSTSNGSTMQRIKINITQSGV